MLPTTVSPERHEIGHSRPLRAIAHGSPGRETDRSQAARAHIAVEVAPAELGQCRRTHHVPADDRAHPAPVPERQGRCHHAAGPPGTLRLRPSKYGQPRFAGARARSGRTLTSSKAASPTSATIRRRLGASKESRHGTRRPEADRSRARHPRAWIQPHDLAVEPGRVLARIAVGAEAKACVEEAVRAERGVASHVDGDWSRHREDRPGRAVLEPGRDGRARRRGCRACTPARRALARRESERERAALVSQLVPGASRRTSGERHNTLRPPRGPMRQTRPLRSSTNTL